MKKLVLTLAVSLSGASAWALPIEGDDGHYYDVIQAPGITWADARVAALSNFYLGLQGHLVTITSAAEHAFVNAAIAANGGGEMWAGGYQNPAGETDPQAGWTWVNGEGSFPGFNSDTPYALWNNGEPNDAYGLGSEQFLGLNWGAGGFNDEGNLLNITGYVIEYDPNTIPDVPGVPDAGTTASLLAGAFAMLGVVSRRFRR
jgi:hypothetical protein